MTARGRACAEVHTERKIVMTKLKAEPGICGMTAIVSADCADGETVTISVESPCPAIQKMMEELGGEFDMFDVCMVKPGTGPFYSYAAENLPGHAGCPICAAIHKCAEAACGMALQKDVSFTFLKE